MATQSFYRPTDNVKYIIELVKSKPELYDPKHPLYTHRCANMNAWSEISSALNVPVYVFRAKWNCIRNSYSRVLRRRRFKKTDTQKWYLEDNLSFLTPIINTRKRKCKTSSNNIENSIEQADTTGQSGGSLQSMTDIEEFNQDIENIDTENNNIDNNDTENNDTENNNIDKDNTENNIDNNDTDNNNPENIETVSLDDLESNLEEEIEIEENKIEKLNKKYKETKSNSKEFDKCVDFLTNYLNGEPLLTINNSAQKCKDLFFQSMQKDYEKLPEQKKRKFKLIALSAINELLDEED